MTAISLGSFLEPDNSEIILVHFGYYFRITRSEVNVTRHPPPGHPPIILRFYFHFANKMSVQKYISELVIPYVGVTPASCILFILFLTNG